MPIIKVHIQNFTVFENMEIAFSEGVNIVIGANGTGKTHLLKSLYAICEGVNANNSKAFDIAQSYFLVESTELKREKDDHSKRSFVQVNFSETSAATFELHKPGVKETFARFGDFQGKAIFIPEKEMLAHSRGFLALYNKYPMPFDKTYVDILTNAELPEAREIADWQQVLLKKISDVIQGEVLHENGSFYLLKEDGRKIAFPIESEGFRKFGLLWKVLKNSLLEEGAVLFWDTPETSMNPELMPILVELMLTLQRNGVQLIVATHSYNFAKYFEVKRNKSDHVRFHHLYQTNKGVQVESGLYFSHLKDNPIIEADAKLLDEVIEGNFDD